MLAAAVVVFASVAAAPSYSLMVTRRVGLTPPQAQKLAEQLAKELAQRDVSLGTLMPLAEFNAALKALGLDDPTSCAGATPCVSDYGRGGGVDYVIGLQLMKVGKEVAIDTSVVRVDRAEVLAAPTESVLLASPTAGLGTLAGKIAQALAQRPKDEPPPTPPPEPPPAAAVDRPAADTRAGGEVRTEAPAPRPSSKKRPLLFAAIGAGVGGLLSGGIGLVLGITAQGQARALAGNDPDYDAKRAGIESLARGADISYVVAGVLAATAVALLIVSLLSN